MKISSDARSGVSEYLDEETYRRQAIVTCEGALSLPSVAEYIDEIRPLQPLTGVERELFDRTLPRLKQNEEDERRALDEMMAADQCRMDILRGIDPVDGAPFATRQYYSESVKSLGDLSTDERRVHLDHQTMVLDFYDGFDA